MHAMFLLAGTPEAVCAVTRPGGGLGLPGGKVEPGESPGQTIRRETFEEGWALPAGAPLSFVHSAEVDGWTVEWYATTQTPTMMANHKDAARGIWPVLVNSAALTSMGNPEAIAAWNMWLARRDVSMRAPSPPLATAFEPRRAVKYGRRCAPIDDPASPWCATCPSDGPCHDFR